MGGLVHDYAYKYASLRHISGEPAKMTQNKADKHRQKKKQAKDKQRHERKGIFHHNPSALPARASMGRSKIHGHTTHSVRIRSVLVRILGLGGQIRKIRGPEGPEFS